MKYLLKPNPIHFITSPPTEKTLSYKQPAIVNRQKLSLSSNVSQTFILYTCLS